MRGGVMKTWMKITASLMLIAATGVGVWAIVDKLDDATFKLGGARSKKDG
jgi:hypothetical protein